MSWYLTQVPGVGAVDGLFCAGSSGQLESLYMACELNSVQVVTSCNSFAWSAVCLQLVLLIAGQVMWERQDLQGVCRVMLLWEVWWIQHWEVWWFQPQWLSLVRIQVVFASFCRTSFCCCLEVMLCWRRRS
jgi:hypothetical protein